MAYYYDFRPYVPVAERRRNAAREMQKLRKNGHPVSPVVIEGRTIARTFWGKAWCENLERYSDYANRLPRGRTYVRNGSVVDLQIAPGKVTAVVSGSELYQVAVKVSAVPKARWNSICADCAGGIDSLVELLQGRFSKGVMERICQQQSGLFPAPTEIHLSCSCPDWATLCKHVAAVLYGVGARFDEQPELLFRLREVDEKELIAKAGKGLRLSAKEPSDGKVLGGDLAELFGLDLGASDGEPVDQERPVKAQPMPRSTEALNETPINAKSKPTAKPAANTKSKPAAKRAAKSKPTAKRGVNAKARPAAKPAANTKSKPAAKRAVNAKSKPAAKPAANTKSRPAAKPAANTKSKPAAKRAVNAKSKPAAKTKSRTAKTLATKARAKPALAPNPARTARPKAKTKSRTA